MNKLCYCKAQLVEFGNPYGYDWCCINCCKQIPNTAKHFKCPQECIYFMISTQPYVICEECYSNDDNDDNKFEEKDEEMIIFISNKFNYSLKTIS